jgi:hypothetical protein
MAEPLCRVAGDGAFALQNLGHLVVRHKNLAGPFAWGDAERGEFLGRDVAGVNGGVAYGVR